MSFFVFNYSLKYEWLHWGSPLLVLIKGSKNKIEKMKRRRKFTWLLTAEFVKSLFQFTVSGLSGAHYINKAAINGWCSD